MGKYNVLFSINKKIIDIAALFIRAKRFPQELKSKNVMQRNKELGKYKKSDVCYILGLGPSLKDVDLRKINGDIIAVNSFVDYKTDIIINPNYYCILDGIDYIEQSSSVIQRATKKFKDTAFVLNGKYKKYGDEKACPGPPKYYIYEWGKNFYSNTHYNLCKIMPITGNIVCFALLLAMELGYKKIFLLGCDFNSFASRKQLHCYEEDNNERTLSLSYELFCYSFCADTHEQIAKYAKNRGIEIINATDGSLIDAYLYDTDVVKYYKKERN